MRMTERFPIGSAWVRDGTTYVVLEHDDEGDAYLYPLEGDLDDWRCPGTLTCLKYEAVMLPLYTHPRFRVGTQWTHPNYARGPHTVLFAANENRVFFRNSFEFVWSPHPEGGFLANAVPA